MNVITGKTRLGLRVFCGAACYNAQTKKCSCVCSGYNHGKGLAAALRNATAILPEITELWDAIHPHEPLVEIRARHKTPEPSSTFPLFDAQPEENVIE